MSDLMSSLVFIFIITLMVFAFRFNVASARATSARDTRAELLALLEEALKARGLEVLVDLDQGVLRLTERSVRFDVGESEPRAADKENLEAIAAALREVLPCFVESEFACTLEVDREKYAAVVDVVLIEGHTDSRPILPGTRFEGNLELSTARAAAVFRELHAAEEELRALTNDQGVRLLSVSGYADQRLLIRDNGEDDRNRRIDLRFLMAPPPGDVLGGRESAAIPPTRDRLREARP